MIAPWQLDGKFHERPSTRRLGHVFGRSPVVHAGSQLFRHCWSGRPLTKSAAYSYLNSSAAGFARSSANRQRIDRLEPTTEALLRIATRSSAFGGVEWGRGYCELGVRLQSCQRGEADPGQACNFLLWAASQVEVELAGESGRHDRILSQPRAMHSAEVRS